MNKPDPIPARLAALKTTPTPDLKKQWRDLFDSEPPPFNRRYLEEPAGLPHPGTGLWRAEARDDPAAGAAGRGTGRRRPERSAASAPT
jgi:hypothetical protein